MRKKILITGADGQLGRALTTLLKEYYTVLGSVLDISLVKDSPVSLVQTDIIKYEELQKTLDDFLPDMIINTAAFTNVDQSETQKETAWAVNVGGLENIIRCSDPSSRIIHISSDYVFDGKKGPYLEDDPTYPISYYGKTKLAAKNALRGSRRNYLILRPNVLYQSTTHDHASFFAWVFTSLKKSQDINVVTDQTSNPTWVIPFAEAIMSCIILNAGGIYHYGSEDYLNRYQFAMMIAHTFKFDSSLIHPIQTLDLKQPALRPENSGLRTDKIHEELNVKIYPTQYCLNQIKAGMKV